MTADRNPGIIRYAIAKTSLGHVLVARHTPTDGISCILLGDTRRDVERELQSRYPAATLVEDDALTDVAGAARAVESPSVPAGLRLDMRGSEFQRRVWTALQSIPAGATATYAEIARRLDMPNGARAVAQACAANPLAVVVPCHRVVRGDGGLSGYRWGVERKRALLFREGAVTR